MDNANAEAALIFDFEEDIADVVAPTSGDDGPSNGQGRGSFRQTVCRHWLRGLCIKGDSCAFLHQLDRNRMPVCRFFRKGGGCRDQQCTFKHTDEDIKECKMYSMGFCPNGPNCWFKHVKKPGPPPPVEEVLRKLQQMNPAKYGSSNIFNQRRGNNYDQQGEKPQVQHGSVPYNQNLAASASPVLQQPAAQHVQTVNPQHVPPPQQQQQNAQVEGAPNGSSDPATITANPLPQGQSRYSVVKSCNRENLELSVQQVVWAS